jgi:hypothetical protein
MHLLLGILHHFLGVHDCLVNGGGCGDYFGNFMLVARLTEDQRRLLENTISGYCKHQRSGSDWFLLGASENGSPRPGDKRAYASIRELELSAHQHTRASADIWRIREHTRAYVCIREHTNAYASIQERETEHTRAYTSERVTYEGAG